MKYYTFYRENNNFVDILTDINIKKVVDLKISWLRHLMNWYTTTTVYSVILR